jgi:hypothetical protein
MAPKLDQSLGSHHFQFRPICCVGRYLLAQHKIMNLPETGADITILSIFSPKKCAKMCFFKLKLLLFRQTKIIIT